MTPSRPSTKTDEEYLGELAMKFRGTRLDAERQDVAKKYSDTVNRLINSNAWAEAPSPEDQLPDKWMPTEFFEYWSSDLP